MSTARECASNELSRSAMPRRRRVLAGLARAGADDPGAHETPGCVWALAEPKCAEPSHPDQAKATDRDLGVLEVGVLLAFRYLADVTAEPAGKGRDTVVVHFMMVARFGVVAPRTACDERGAGTRSVPRHLPGLLVRDPSPGGAAPHDTDRPRGPPTRTRGWTRRSASVGPAPGSVTSGRGGPALSLDHERPAVRHTRREADGVPCRAQYLSAEHPTPDLGTPSPGTSNQ